MKRKYLKIYEEFNDWADEGNTMNAGERKAKDIGKIPAQSKEGLSWYTGFINTVKEYGNKLKSVFNRILSSGKALSEKVGKLIIGTSKPGALVKNKEGWYTGDGAWYWNTIKAQADGKNKMKNNKEWKIYVPNIQDAPDDLNINKKDFTLDDMPDENPMSTKDSILNTGELEDSEEYDTAKFEIEESLKTIFEDSGYLTSDKEVSLENIGMEDLVTQIKASVIQGNRMGKYKAPLIWGAPGIGKTEVVLQAAKALGLPLIVIPLANMQNVDFLGLPVVSEEGATTFAPPIIFPREDGSSNTTKYIDQFSKDDVDIRKTQDRDTGGIIFLDEINRADEAVLGSCLSFISLRIIGQYKLPEKWHIVAACNREKDVSGQITEMDAAVASTGRFRAYNLVPNLPQWIHQYARGKGMEYKDEETGEVKTDTSGNTLWKIPNEIIDFLEFNEYDSKSITDILSGDNDKLKGDYKFFYRKREGEVAQSGEGLNATPRQWSDLGRFLTDAVYNGSPETGETYENLMELYKNEPSFVNKLVNGEIGRAVGKEFIRFLNLKSKIDFSLVPKVFNFRKEPKEIQNRIIEQLGEKGISSNSKKGSRVSEKGFAFLSAVSGYANTKKQNINGLISYITFLTNMNDEITAVTQFIKTAFPMWNNIKSHMKKALNSTDDQDKLKSLNDTKLKIEIAWENMKKELRNKWSTSFGNVFDNIDEWNKNKNKNKNK